MLIKSNIAKHKVLRNELNPSVSRVKRESLMEQIKHQTDLERAILKHQRHHTVQLVIQNVPRHRVIIAIQKFWVCDT